MLSLFALDSNSYSQIADHFIKEEAEIELDKLEEKWAMPIRNWSLTISQLNIIFKERLKDKLDLV